VDSERLSGQWLSVSEEFIASMKCLFSFNSLCCSVLQQLEAMTVDWLRKPDSGHEKSVVNDPNVYGTSEEA
jgi:hypothetical protein